MDFSLTFFLVNYVAPHSARDEELYVPLVGLDWSKLI